MRIIVLAILVGLVWKGRADAELLFVGDFECGTLETWVHPPAGNCCPDTVTVVSSPHPVRAGRFAARHLLRDGDGARAELRPAIELFRNFDLGAEYWIGWSVFIPRSWTVDTKADEIIFQIHALRDYALGETYGRKPPMALKFDRDGALRLYNRWDRNPVTPRDGMGKVIQPEFHYAVAWPRRDGWTDYVLHVKWSYEDDGYTELYRDRVLIARRQGPNTFNDRRGPYLKFGIYKHAFAREKMASSVSRRELYYDEIRIGDANSSLQEVSPPTAPPRRRKGKQRSDSTRDRVKMRASPGSKGKLVPGTKVPPQ